MRYLELQNRLINLKNIDYFDYHCGLNLEILFKNRELSLKYSTEEERNVDLDKIKRVIDMAVIASRSKVSHFVNEKRV